MVVTAVAFTSCPFRVGPRRVRAGLAFAAVMSSASWACGQSAAPADAGAAPTSHEPVATSPAPASAAPVAGPTISLDPADREELNPIAIVPIEAANHDQAQVTGALQVSNGTAFILSSGAVTSGSMTTSVVLPHRGVLRVCSSTTVHLSTDKSVPAGETPGLMMALDHGAVEASFATGKNSDILLTPDFRILIGGPGAAEVKVRLGEHGDTCVDNPGTNAPYVVVSSVFEGGAYRVQPGQRVMFQHGSLKEVVDQEKEPCGCPVEPRPGTNDFPLAQSAGLAPLEKPAPEPKPGVSIPGQAQPMSEPLVYSARRKEAEATSATSASSTPAAPAPATTSQPAKKKVGFFGSIGRFFRKIFGAE